MCQACRLQAIANTQLASLPYTGMINNRQSQHSRTVAAKKVGIITQTIFHGGRSVTIGDWLCETSDGGSCVHIGGGGDDGASSVHIGGGGDDGGSSVHIGGGGDDGGSSVHIGGGGDDGGCSCEVVVAQYIGGSQKKIS